jgi:hypothetical protein
VPFPDLRAFIDRLRDDDIVPVDEGGMSEKYDTSTSGPFTNIQAGESSSACSTRLGSRKKGLTVTSGKRR